METLREWMTFGPLDFPSSLDHKRPFPPTPKSLLGLILKHNRRTLIPIGSLHFVAAAEKLLFSAGHAGVEGEQMHVGKAAVFVACSLGPGLGHGGVIPGSSCPSKLFGWGRIWQPWGARRHEGPIQSRESRYFPPLFSVFSLQLWSSVCEVVCEYVSRSVSYRCRNGIGGVTFNVSLHSFGRIFA